MTTRRSIIRIIPIAGAAVLSGRLARAGEVEPSHPLAVSLGYVKDGAKVDKAKYASYAAGQDCAGCKQYQGKPGDPTAGCTIFGGRNVTAKGWCSAWVKKA